MPHFAEEFHDGRLVGVLGGEGEFGLVDATLKLVLARYLVETVGGSLKTYVPDVQVPLALQTHGKALVGALL